LALGPFELEGNAAADVLGRSDGVEASLELTWNKVFGRGKAGLFPGIGVVWQDADFVDYYAGVRPGEALPERPAFEGRSAFNIGAGIRAFSRLTHRFRTVGLVRAERLANEFEDGPIIEDRWAYFGLLGIAFEL
jgi:outer membrane protein